MKLPDLWRSGDTVTDPALRKLYLKTVGKIADIEVQGHGDERKMRKVAFYSFLWVFVGSTAVTVVLMVLGTLGLVHLDDKYLNRLYTAFVVEMLPVAGWIFKRIFWKSE